MSNNFITDSTPLYYTAMLSKRTPGNCSDCPKIQKRCGRLSVIWYRHGLR